jgi:YggT family protein
MAFLVITLLELYAVVLIVRAILSWVSVPPDSPVRPVADVLHAITEPVLGPIRRSMPPLGGIDLSVLVVILAIHVVLVPLAARLLP